MLGASTLADIGPKMTIPVHEYWSTATMHSNCWHLAPRGDTISTLSICCPLTWRVLTCGCLTGRCWLPRQPDGYTAFCRIIVKCRHASHCALFQKAEHWCHQLWLHHSVSIPDRMNAIVSVDSCVILGIRKVYSVLRLEYQKFAQK